jgi:hypothetical protein
VLDLQAEAPGRVHREDVLHLDPKAERLLHVHGNVFADRPGPSGVGIQPGIGIRPHAEGRLLGNGVPVRGVASPHPATGTPTSRAVMKRARERHGPGRRMESIQVDRSSGGAETPAKRAP